MTSFTLLYADGAWLSFALRIGSDAQVVRVLISTAGQVTWVVSTLGLPHQGVK